MLLQTVLKSSRCHVKFWQRVVCQSIKSKESGLILVNIARYLAWLDIPQAALFLATT